MEGLTTQQLIFLVILTLAFVVLMTEKIRNDIVAVLIVLALATTGILKPDEALRGFSSEPAIVVAGIFVLSAALHHTGVSGAIGRLIGRLAGESYERAVAVIMPSVAILSAFTHHLTTTAVMLPVTLDLAHKRGIAPSRLLMPLSFAASLGTCITIIGAPAFLIASTVLQQNGRPGLGIFDIAPVGLAITAAGTLLILVAGRFLLPERRGSSDSSERFKLDQYFTEVVVLPQSPHIGKSLREIQSMSGDELKVFGWIRNGHHLNVAGKTGVVEEGDVLLVRATPEAVVAVRTDPGFEIHPVAEYEEQAEIHDDEAEEVSEMLVQAIVAPGSELVGQTIGDVDFLTRYGVLVVGLHRQNGWFDDALAKVRLAAGDVLVVQGSADALRHIDKDPAFLMLVPFHGETQMRRKAPVAGAIMLGTILAAAFNLLTIEMAALAGAVAAILTGCLTTRQAYRAIDQRIFVFIAGAIPLGEAMKKTGTAELLAGLLQNAVGSWGETAILLAIFAIVGILTQLMSDAATTALFAPVAAALAMALGHAPEPYVITVAMAAVASFLTPIGHHGNLLIYGPGGYRFWDFVVSGAPLTVVVGFVVVVVSQWVW